MRPIAGGDSAFQHGGWKSFEAQTGPTGAVSGTREYDAFGAQLGSTGSWQGGLSHGGGFGYQTDDTGLQLLGHRYYDASTGRFLTRDPIKDGPNWYAYCLNDPVNHTDPTGLVKITAYWYEAGRSPAPIFIPPVFTATPVGYHIGIAVQDNLRGRGRTYLYNGGPEFYGSRPPWGRLVDKRGYVGDGVSQDAVKKTRVVIGMGVVLVDDDSPVEPWLWKLDDISDRMDGRVGYGFPGPNSNSWARELMDHLGLVDEFNSARGKRWPLADPWAPGFDYEVVQ